MNTALIIIGLCVALGIVAILLYRRSSTAKSAAPDISEVFLDSFPAQHPHDFPIIQQALSDSDADFLDSRVANGPRRRARAARRAAALSFLAGLRRDYRKLSDLSRVLLKVAPETAQADEMERIKLQWKFNFMFVIVWLKLRTGALPIAQLHALSDTIGALAGRLEIAVNEWQETSILAKVGMLD